MTIDLLLLFGCTEWSFLPVIIVITKVSKCKLRISMESANILRSLREIMAAAADENSDEVSCVPSADAADAITSTNPLDAYDLWQPKAREECVVCMQTLP